MEEIIYLKLENARLASKTKPEHPLLLLLIAKFIKADVVGRGDYTIIKILQNVIGREYHNGKSIPLLLLAGGH